MHAVPDPPDGALDAELLAHAQQVVRAQIQRLRVGRELSQGEAGGRVGWNQSYWSRLENGPIELRLEHLLQVQRALGLDSVEALFGTLPSELTSRGKVPE